MNMLGIGKGGARPVKTRPAGQPRQRFLERGRLFHFTRSSLQGRDFSGDLKKRDRLSDPAQ
jgi:hypothetical protein